MTDPVDAPRSPGARRGVGGAGAGGVIVAIALLVVLAMRRGAADTVVPHPLGLVPSAPATPSPRLFVAADSTSLHGLQYAGNSRGTVILLHGLGEADTLFARWAAAIGQATAMNVVAVSLGGNGRSRGTRPADRGPDAYATDVGAVVRELKRRNPSGPVLLLASHGGLGIAAQFLASRARLALPRVQGVIAIDGTGDDRGRVTNGRPFLVFPWRLGVLTALSSLGVSWFDGVVVAEQSGAPDFPPSRWSHAEWRGSAPRLNPLLAATDNGEVPLLVLSGAPAPAATASNGTAANRTWVRVTGALDPNTEPVGVALDRWAAVFSADAHDPTPPKATQTLEVLPRSRP